MGIVAMNPPHPFEPTPHQPPLTFAGGTGGTYPVNSAAISSKTLT
jgi:hypothetical protein